MPLSTAAKAVLCLCPPAVMAGTVATVPVAKRAVHHLTAEHHAPKPLRRLTTASALPANRRVDCDPAASTAIPAVPLVTYAAPIPGEPDGSATGTSGGPARSTPAIAALAAIAPVAAVPFVSPVSDSNPVPEPATWLMIIVGAGVIGAMLRRRADRRPTTRYAGSGAKAAAGMAVWGTSAAVEAGDVATTVAAKSAIASVAGKAMLCVCPAAIVAGSVMTVPPLRHAVHASTATPLAPPLTAAVPLPCDQAVPVSAASVKGFPDTVSTVPLVPEAAAAG